MSPPTRYAITRPVPGSITNCQLTHLARSPIDIDRARTQHADCNAALQSLGCTLLELEPLDEHPDSVFVEDMALVLPTIAVALRSGAPTRRGESASVINVVSMYRDIVSIEEPGTVDGGDLLHMGNKVFAGRSTRSNAEGLEQLGRHLEQAGLELVILPVDDCLHLKSGATAIGDQAILCNPDWVDPSGFGDVEIIEVDPGEPHGGNVVRLGDTLLASNHPRTNQRLTEAGCDVHWVDMSELGKAEGDITCCSIIFEHAD